MAEQTETSARRQRSAWDALLVALFLAGNIFAAWTVAGFGGIWCWLLGGVSIPLARAAWGLFRA